MKIKPKATFSSFIKLIFASGDGSAVAQ